MRILVATIAGAGLLLGACSKKDKDAGGGQGGGQGGDPKADLSGPCPALAVTVEGAPLEGLVHGHAVTMVNGSYTTHVVQLFNHDKSTCEEMLSGRRSVHDGEVTVRAFHGEMPGVGVDSYTHVAGTLTLDKPTDKVGEPMQICVRTPIEFTPTAGDFKGKKVTVVGTFTAKFCGSNAPG